MRRITVVSKDLLIRAEIGIPVGARWMGEAREGLGSHIAGVELLPTLRKAAQKYARSIRRPVKCPRCPHELRPRQLRSFTAYWIPDEQGLNACAIGHHHETRVPCRRTEGDWFQ